MDFISHSNQIPDKAITGFFQILLQFISHPTIERQTVKIIAAS
jgi:hypothetical protein